MKSILFTLLTLMSLDVLAVELEATKTKTIELTPYTSFSLELVPDLGTRLIFPFVLDEQDAYVPYTMNVTNPIFQTVREDGRNSIVLKVSPPMTGGQMPTFLGTMYITVAGYDISVALKTTSDIDAQVSDVFFTLSDEAREDLIQEAVKKRSASLEKSYQEQLAELDQKANDLAMKKVGYVVMQTPDETSIEEEGQYEFDTGEIIELYLEQMVSYGNFRVFEFEVANDTDDNIRIKDVVLFRQLENGEEQRIRGAYTITPRVESGEYVRGVVSVEAKLVDKGDRIKLSVLTNKAPVEVLW